MGRNKEREKRKRESSNRPNIKKEGSKHRRRRLLSSTFSSSLASASARVPAAKGREPVADRTSRAIIDMSNRQLHGSIAVHSGLNFRSNSISNESHENKTLVFTPSIIGDNGGSQEFIESPVKGVTLS